MNRLSGTVTPPGDKSISHRAVLLGAMASGTSRLSGLNPGADVASSIGVVRALGVTVRHHGETTEIHGVDGRFVQPEANLDCGNSGTTMRLTMGMVAGCPDLDVHLVGDRSLSGRPMERVASPLRRLGAEVETDRGHAPVRVRGSRLRGGDIQTEVASAQIKSAVLLAGLRATGPTTVREPAASRDHTERLLARMGATIERDEAGTIVLTPSSRLTALDMHVPADPSAGAFYVVAASLLPGSEVRVRGVSMNPTRSGYLAVLTRMGAKIEVAEERESGGEPVADLVVTSSTLRATDIHPDEVPSLIDEVPILSVAAAGAVGTTRIRGAAELRVKESDRIRAMCEGLSRLGVAVTECPDGLDIVGSGRPLKADGPIDTAGDHRVVMSFRVAALLVEGGLRLDDADVAHISDPNFERELAQLVSE